MDPSRMGTVGESVSSLTLNSHGFLGVPYLKNPSDEGSG